MATIRIVRKAPGETPQVLQVASKLESLQALVGGPLELFRASLLRDLGAFLYVNEDGLRLDLAPCLALDGVVLRGPVIVSRVDAQGEEEGLTPEQAAEVIRRLSAN